MGQQATISRQKSEEAAVMAVLDDFIAKRRQKAAARRAAERAKKEKNIFHKIRKFIFPLGTDEVLVYGEYTYRDSLIKVDKAYEERQEILALLREFEIWYAEQPPNNGKTEAYYLKKFLADKHEVIHNG